MKSLQMKPQLVTWITRMVWAVLAGCVVGAFTGWAIARTLHIPQLDQLPTYRPASTTEVLAADGSQVATFALERRVELPPDQIPDNLKLAIVAIEDGNFYNHGGVDPKAILRAVIGSIKTWKLGGQGGASTLTQQLARDLFLSRERRIARKIREMFLALDMEKRLSKDQIISMYANQIYFGQGAYGVEAASLLYFDKPAIELELYEAAMLAGMIQNPERLHNPIRNPEGTKNRRDRVLGKMFELGFIDQGSYRAGLEAPLGLELHKAHTDNGAYFLEHVRRKIENDYGTNTLYKGGLQVDLTMDPGLQKAAEAAVREGLVELETNHLGFRRPPNVVKDGRAQDAVSYIDPSWQQLSLVPGDMVRAVVLEVSRSKARLRLADREAEFGIAAAKWTKASSLKRILRPGDLVFVRLPDPLPEDDEAVLSVELLQEPEIEGALLAMDNRTGAVLAMVGGFDFERSEFNRATQSKLQCGSAFKPFVYLTAFEAGYTPADTLFDAPFLLPDAIGELTYCPKNYYNKYYGITTLRRALEASFNASAVKLQDMVGGQAVVDTAKAMGISTELHPYASLALGTLGVRLIDLVRAYAGFANLGEIPQPYFIAEVRDRDGRQLERFFPTLERGASAPATYLLLHVLEGVVERGTGMKARALDAHLAGKTGTTDEYSDAWFVGSSPRITVGVWVGRDHKAPIGKRMTGAAAALPIWIRFMEVYLETLDEAARAERFSIPAGVVFSAVDRYSGHLVVPACSTGSEVILDAFLDGTEPNITCEEDDPALRDLPWLFQQAYYAPRDGEPMPTPEALICADDRFKPDEDEDEDAPT
ncbi:MAG: PBP1A family penicillin-binding protein [Thermoanaerobaculales bacterium]|nr:PBP1A family penicillin-binding protein [Thermoanaerobaculales bacterium]